jgi:HK97 family phage portal protein
MNALLRWFERRSLARPAPALLSLFSSTPTPADMAVTPQTAAGVPAVFSCLQVLSQDVARTPINFREQVAPDTYVDALDHPLYELLHDLPNPEQTSYQVKAFLMWQLLVFGRAFAEIVRSDEGRIIALWPLCSEGMTVDRTEFNRKRWTYTAGGQVYTWLFDASQPPILELVSESPIQRCRNLIGSALALETYVGKFFANGAKPSGILQAPQAVDPSTASRIKDYWASTYSGSANAHKTPLLDSGLTYTAISSSNEHAQVTELQRAINEAIAGAFRVPTWKIGDLSKTTYSNMESGETSYVVSTLDPYFQLFEEAIQRDLLTTRQFGRYSVSFDRGALIRSDVKSLHDSLATGIQNGIYSQNDARKRLGLNPIPDGDDYYRNSALVRLETEQEAPRVA